MAEVWAKLDTLNALHQRVLRLLEEAGGETVELGEVSPSPQPAGTTGSVPPPVPAAILTPQHARLRGKVLKTKVGVNFLVPVIRQMTPGQAYTLRDLASLAGVSMRKAHAFVCCAGRIEKRFGKIFEREDGDVGQPLVLKVTPDIKQAFAA